MRRLMAGGGATGCVCCWTCRPTRRRVPELLAGVRARARQSIRCTARRCRAASAAVAHGFDAALAGRCERDELLDWLMGAWSARGWARSGLCFVHRYPASQAALARLDSDDPRVALRFELYSAASNWPTASRNSAMPPSSARASSRPAAAPSAACRAGHRRVAAGGARRGTAAGVRRRARLRSAADAAHRRHAHRARCCRSRSSAPEACAAALTAWRARCTRRCAYRS